MEKLIQFALSTKFGENTAAIMDVIAATANPTIAAEMLLGLYEEPTIPFRDSMLENQKDNRAEITVIDYKRISDEVVLQYCRIIHKSAWFKNGDFAVEPNIACDYYHSDDAAKKLGMSEEEFKANYFREEYHVEVSSTYQTMTMSLSSWIDYSKKCYIIVNGDVDDDVEAEHNSEAHQATKNQ